MKKSKFVISIARKMPQNLLRSLTLLRGLFARKHYLTFHNRPKSMKDDKVIRLSNRIMNDTAIIVQGPIKFDSDFTLETFKHYRVIYPKATLILSTWKGYSDRQLNPFRSIVDVVIESEKPENIGHNNLNLQIKSTLEGLKIAKRMKIPYSIKTRTDQRIYSNSFIEYLKAITCQYSVVDSKQQERIVLVDINTSKYKLFSVSDMFQFSSTNELITFWNCVIEEQENIPSNFYFGMTLIEVSKHTTAESYLATKYLNKLRIAYEFTIESYYKVLRDRFIVIDKESIDLFWYKYSAGEYEFNINYTNDHKRDKIRHADWIQLYNGLSDFSHLDHVMDSKF